MKVLFLLGAVALCQCDPVTVSFEPSIPLQNLLSTLAQGTHSTILAEKTKEAEPKMTTILREVLTAEKSEVATKPTEEATQDTKEEANEKAQNLSNRITSLTTKEEVTTILPEKISEPTLPPTIAATEKAIEVTTPQIKTTEVVETEPMPTPLAVAAGPSNGKPETDKPSEKPTDNPKPKETTAPAPPEVPSSTSTQKAEVKTEEAPAMPTTQTTVSPVDKATLGEVTTVTARGTTKAEGATGNSRSTKKPGNSCPVLGVNIVVLFCTSVFLLFSY